MQGACGVLDAPLDGRRLSLSRPISDGSRDRQHALCGLPAAGVDHHADKSLPRGNPMPLDLLERPVEITHADRNPLQDRLLQSVKSLTVRADQTSALNATSGYALDPVP